MLGVPTREDGASMTDQVSNLRSQLIRKCICHHRDGMGWLTHQEKSVHRAYPRNKRQSRFGESSLLDNARRETDETSDYVEESDFSFESLGEKWFQHRHFGGSYRCTLPSVKTILIRFLRSANFVPKPYRLIRNEKPGFHRFSPRVDDWGMMQHASQRDDRLQSAYAPVLKCQGVEFFFAKKSPESRPNI